jgi:hypothetical protein
VRRLLAFALLVGCSDAGGGAEEPPPLPPLSVTVQGLEVASVLPGTRARVRGDGFLEGAQFEVTLHGAVGGATVDLALPAERVDDGALAVTFPPAAVTPLGEGTLQGTLHVALVLDDARGEADAPVSVEVRQTLTPVVTGGAAAAFPATPFELRGSGFLDASEGESIVEIRGRFTRDGDGGAEMLDVGDVPAQRPGGDAPWGRDALSFVFDPAWVGISPGALDLEVRVVNRGLGWLREGEWHPVRVDLLAPVIEAIDPPAASRGERITISGQGFLGGDQEGGYTALRLEGTFRADDGQTVELSGPTALEVDPLRLDGRTLVFAMQPRYDADCHSADLGARAGTFEGRVTPVAGWRDETVEGDPTPMTFAILPPKQVVWLRFLPAFTDSLRLFGLRDVSREVEARILEVIRRDYAGINVEVRVTEPLDFIDYSVVEIGGPDPNAQQLFGLDNTPGFDHCNQRLNDNLAGHNADSEGFGGIFVESFLQLSLSRHDENPLAHPAFDEIFDPFIDDPVEPGELPDGARAAEIARAIRTLGSLVGNTATHEIGHSLGLPAVVGCGEYHNPPGDGQIMDCGQDRPFEERAELDGHPPATWMTEDRAYLERILPAN